MMNFYRNHTSNVSQIFQVLLCTIQMNLRILIIFKIFFYILILPTLKSALKISIFSQRWTLQHKIYHIPKHYGYELFIYNRVGEHDYNFASLNFEIS